jgi:hypothetical protein
VPNEPAVRGTVSSDTRRRGNRGSVRAWSIRHGRQTPSAVLARRLVIVGVALSLPFATWNGSAEAASSRGVNASGTVQCSISATIKYKPAQTRTGSLPDKLTIKGQLSACTSTGSATVLSGKVTGVSTGGVNSCSVDWTSPIAVTVRWKATTRINPTKGSLTSISTVNNGSHITFTADGTATSGSYSGDAVDTSVTTLETSQQISAACSSSRGLKSADVSGSATFS